jgi:tripeptide aminopeptidase
MQGDEEKAELVYILRDHDARKFDERKENVLRIGTYLNAKYGPGTVSVELRDSYRNMREIVEQYPDILERAKEAFLDSGVEPIIKPIRGGTDGARLSFMGLPCPNLSTGGYNFHGRKELIPVQAMEKMTEVLWRLVKGK